MKTKLITLFALASFFLNPLKASAQMPDSAATVKQWLDYIYSQLDTSAYNNTGILMDRGFIFSGFKIQAIPNGIVYIF